MGDVFNAVAVDEVSLMTVVIYLVLAFIVSAIAGAVGGIIVGGKHMGNDLAAMMGSFYGPMSAVPGALLALIILVFI